MEELFEKYDISLSEWNVVDKICDVAKMAKKSYEKNDEKGLKQLAYLKVMIEDLFEAKGEAIDDYL